MCTVTGGSGFYHRELYAKLADRLGRPSIKIIVDWSALIVFYGGKLYEKNRNRYGQRKRSARS